MTAADAVFGLLGLVALLGAVAVVTSSNVVHAALWLVVCFGGLAGCYLVLTAEFVAWVQVLIYIGAVVVLLLFGAMLTRAPVGGRQQLDGPHRMLAATAGLLTAAVLGTLVVAAFRSAYVDLRAGGVGDGKALGAAVFRQWVLPFELASVLLLAALVGAIVLTRRGTDPTEDARR